MNNYMKILKYLLILLYIYFICAIVHETLNGNIYKIFVSNKHNDKHNNKLENALTNLFTMKFIIKRIRLF